MYPQPSYQHQPPQGYPPQGYPQPAPYVQQRAPSGEPLYHVTVTKHTGLMILWWNQRTRITGTYEQCEAAIDNAQTHCLVAGWWSIASILVINWISLYSNSKARKSLRTLVAQDRAQAAYSGYPPPGQRGWQTPNAPAR